MDLRAEKLAAIEQRKGTRAGEYPALWQKMLAEWRCPEESDRAWLLYSANYLLRTGGVRWALDPLSLRRRLPAAPEVDHSPLEALDYVVLTHAHADHFDPDLLHRLRELPARWIVPEDLLRRLEILNLPNDKVIVPRPMERLQLGTLTLTCFDGLHREAAPERPTGQRGPPASGYLAEFNGKRWLFPGDTRTYDAAGLPHFDDLNGLVAHLWLGRGQALCDVPPLLEAFCRFCLDLGAERIILTHLEEFGREVEEYWDESHALKTLARLHEIEPGVNVSAFLMGESFGL